MGLLDKIFNRNNDEKDVNDIEVGYQFGEGEDAIPSVTLSNVIGPSVITTNDNYRDVVLISDTVGHHTVWLPFFMTPTGYPHIFKPDMLDQVLANGFVNMHLAVNAFSTRESVKKFQDQEQNMMVDTITKSQQGQIAKVEANRRQMDEVTAHLRAADMQLNQLFEISLTGVITADSIREADMRAASIEGQFASVNGSIARFDQQALTGVKLALPLGYHEDNTEAWHTYREVSRSAVAMIDFARSGASVFNEGFPFIKNLSTPAKNIEYYNHAGTDIMPVDSYSMIVTGSTGGGKSFAVKVFLYRDILMTGNPKRGFDPDGEYISLAKALGKHGLNLTFDHDSPFVINVIEANITEIDIEELTGERDADGEPLETDALVNSLRSAGKKVVYRNNNYYVQRVSINEAIDMGVLVMNTFLTTLKQEPMNERENRLVLNIMRKLFEERGINSDPDSLYSGTPGTRNGLYYKSLPKDQPTLTDLFIKLNEEKGAERLVNTLAEFVSGIGTYTLFDGQTNYGNNISTKLEEFLYVNYDMSKLDGENTRLKFITMTLLGYQVSNSWMKAPNVADKIKLIMFEELTTFTTYEPIKDLAAYIAQRGRKYSAGGIYVTQDMSQFETDQKYISIKNNSYNYMFFKTQSTQAEIVQNLFNLSDGATRIISSTDTSIDTRSKDHAGLFIQGNQVTHGIVDATETEIKLFESNRKKRMEAKL